MSDVSTMTGDDFRRLAREAGEDALSLQEGVTPTETAYYLAEQVKLLASALCEIEARLGRVQRELPAAVHASDNGHGSGSLHAILAFIDDAPKGEPVSDREALSER